LAPKKTHENPTKTVPALHFFSFSPIDFTIKKTLFFLKKKINRYNAVEQNRKRLENTLAQVYTGSGSGSDVLALASANDTAAFGGVWALKQAFVAFFWRFWGLF
jgi:hypothetical protein